MAAILVAEDDAGTRKLMCAVLHRAGFDTLEAADGQQALDVLDCSHVDLLVTDIMMPGIDGLQLVQMLRDARYDLPILMVTAKGSAPERREGFLVGTDDYLVKPVDAQEMVLRIKALLRRAHIVAEKLIRIGEVEVSFDNLTVTRGNDVQTLPRKELYLLFKLLSYPGQAFTRDQLFCEVWGDDSESDPATISVHISRLRKRFEDWPEFDIETVHGIGYRAVCHAS